MSGGTPSTTRSQTLLLVSAAAGVAASLVLTVLAGRWSDAGEFGLFALVAAFLALARDLTDLGTTAVTVRAAVHDPAAEARALEELLGWRLAMSGLVALAALAFSWTQPGAAGRIALAITALTILAMHLNGLIAVFQLRHMLERPALVHLGAQGVAVLLGLLVVALGLPGIAFVGVVLARELLIVAVNRRLAVRLLGYRPRLRRDALRPRSLLGATSTYACAALLFQAVLNSGTFLVRLLADADTFGAYVAAYRLMTPAFSLPWIMTAPLVPLLARAAARDPASFAAQSAGTLLFAGGAAAALGAAGAVLAPDLIALIYGGRFSHGVLSAVMPLRLLMPAFVGVAVTAVRAPALLALGREASLLRLAGPAATLALLLQLLLVPRWGATGGAVAGTAGALVAGFAPVGPAVARIGRAQIAVASLPAMGVAGLLLATPIALGFLHVAFGTALTLGALILLWRLPMVARSRGEQQRWAVGEAPAHG